MENQNSNKFGKKNYEKAVDSFFFETHGNIQPYYAVGALGALLVLSKEEKLHKITDPTEYPADLFGDAKDNLTLIGQHFLAFTERMSHKAQWNLVDIALSITKDELSEAFEYALRKLTIDKNSSEFIQPLEIGKLANEIVKGQGLSVYNPFSGMMSYPTQMNNYNFMVCEDINREAMNMAILRICLTEKGNKVAPFTNDVAYWQTGRFDLIITTPPFRTKITMHDRASSLELGETIALKRFEKSTTEKGQLFTVVPMSFLWSDEKEYAELRKDLIERDFIDTIIMLPSNIFFSTSIATAIVYLSKKKEGKDTVKIVDATDCFIKENPINIIDIEAVLKRLNSENVYSITPSKDDLVKSNYSLDFRRYTPQVEEDIPEGYVARHMDDFVTPIVGEQHFDEQKGHFVTVSSISDNVFDFYHTPEDFPLSGNLSNVKKLTEPALIVSALRPFKSCFVKASMDNPVYISSGVRAFHVNEQQIIPEYLGLLLNNNNRSNYFDLRDTGIIIPRLTIDQVMHQVVMLFHPTIDVQKAVYQERMEEDKLAKVRELGLQDVINKMKAEYINEVRMRKHDMRPYLREIRSAEKLIRLYMSRKDTMENFDLKVMEQLDNCRAAINNLSDLLERLSSEEEFGTPELLDASAYLQYDRKLSSKEDTPSQPGYKVEYDCDEEAFKEAGMPYNLSDSQNKKPHFIKMAHEDLDRLVTNILENSKKHGFTEYGKNYVFHISLSVEQQGSKPMYRIDFADNGNPLPKGMDTFRFGILGEKAGKTAGTGQGGSIVKRIVEHYGGQYDIFSNGEGTTVRIWLPVEENKGE